MRDNIFKIHVNIGGFRLPLNIARKDEELYRKAESKLRNLLDRYHKIYEQRSAEEILSIVAYQLAVDFCKKELSEDRLPLLEKIEKLDKELEQLLPDSE